MDGVDPVAVHELLRQLAPHVAVGGWSQCFVQRWTDLCQRRTHLGGVLLHSAHFFLSCKRSVRSAVFKSHIETFQIVKTACEAVS